MSLQTIHFAVDIVDAFLPLLGALIILGENLRRLWLKTLVFSLVYGSIIFFTDHITLDILRVISNVIIAFVLLKYIFRLTNWFTIKIFITMCLLGLFTNFILFFTIQYGLKIPIKQAVTEKSIWLKVILPGEFLNLPIALIVSKARSRVLYFFANIKGNLNLSVIRSLGLLIFAQVIILVSLIIDISLDVNFAANPFRAVYIFASVIILIVLNILILNKSIHVTAANTLEAAQESILDNIMSLVNSLRSQKHDFINHIQVLNFMLHLGKIEGMRSYLSQLSAEISLFNNVLKIDNPIIGALINAKLTQAEIKDIKFEVYVDANLSAFDHKALELSRILGNLINNAIDAVENLSPEEKWINLTITEKGSSIIFTITNPGSLTRESVTRLFEPGFTTKDSYHSGLGLFICQQLAKKLNGSIDYSCNPLSGISFWLTIPKP